MQHFILTFVKLKSWKLTFKKNHIFVVAALIKSMYDHLIIASDNSRRCWWAWSLQQLWGKTNDESSTRYNARTFIIHEPARAHCRTVFVIEIASVSDASDYQGWCEFEIKIKANKLFWGFIACIEQDNSEFFYFFKQQPTSKWPIESNLSISCRLHLKIHYFVAFPRSVKQSQGKILWLLINIILFALWHYLYKLYRQMSLL